ncbi:hypothetical protein ACFVHQ_09930 [Actinomycetes bacterium NPDC127524]
MNRFFKSKVLVPILSAGFLLAGTANVSHAASGFPVGTVAPPDVKQYKITKISKGNHHYSNSTTINKNVSFKTDITVTKSSKGLTLNTLKISGTVKKKNNNLPYITAVWIQYKSGKVKYYTPKGPAKILKNGTMVFKKNIKISGFENINVEVNNDLVASADKKGTKYHQGINFVKK